MHCGWGLYMVFWAVKLGGVISERCWLVMLEAKQQEATRAIGCVTWWGMGVNLLLFGVKVGVGLVVGSMALVADGVHSISDMVTDVAVLLGGYFGAKRADEAHPFGHGRRETFAAGMIAVVLAVVGGGMIYYAAGAIARNEETEAHVGVLVVAAVSVVLKEVMYKVTKRVAVRLHSTALFANAWHHRSDALSSVAVILGYVGLVFGWGHGDQLAVIAVGVLIIGVAVRVMGDCVRELTESATDAKTLMQIEEIIGSCDGVRGWHKLRTRNVGREVFLDVHVLVDADLDVATAHGIAEDVEDGLHERISRPINVMVHIEPWLGERNR